MSKQHVIQSTTTDALQVLDLSWGSPLHAGDCKLSGFLNGTLNNGPTLRLRRMERRNYWPLFTQKIRVMFGLLKV